MIECQAKIGRGKAWPRGGRARAHLVTRNRARTRLARPSMFSAPSIDVLIVCKDKGKRRRVREREREERQQMRPRVECAAASSCAP